MSQLRPFFCTEESWASMSSAERQQILDMAVNMADPPRTSRAALQTHDPNHDGPYGNPYESRRVTIDPQLLGHPKNA